MIKFCSPREFADCGSKRQKGMTAKDMVREPEEKCSCEFMPECIRNEGIRRKEKTP